MPLRLARVPRPSLGRRGVAVGDQAALCGAGDGRRAVEQLEQVLGGEDGEPQPLGELNRRANQVARLLEARGVGPEVPVGVCLARSDTLLVTILGKGVDKIIIALVIVQWAYYARTIRGTALVERRKEYIEAATCLGLSHRRIVFRHLLPNCTPPLIVVGTVQVAHAIALEATLSFLGVGLPITEPSLGLLIKNGFDYMLSGDYWISFYPGIALLITIVSINLVGDQLRDVLNPRLRR